MYLKSLTLTNFRSFTKKNIDFSERITAIVGDNTTGKTNILEAVYLLATGKSFKAKLEGEMITYGKDLAWINGHVNVGKTITNLEIVLTNGEIKVGDDPKNIKKTQKKKLAVNGVGKRLVDFTGNLRAVLFGPWDMDLVTESPSVRRRFLDFVLSQVDREYRRSLMIYEKGLRQRNKLLLRIRDENVSRAQLIYWDRLLIKHGEYLTNKRGELIEFINIYQYPEDDAKRKVLGSQGCYQLIYDKSVISQGRLDQYAQEEVAAATTLVGPHRDDMQFRIQNAGQAITRDLSRYGSRGEQRMGILWLKLAELSFIKNITGDEPVLLLDDIFSELDHDHRGVVMRICGKQQTIITTADPHYIQGIKGKIVDLK